MNSGRQVEVHYINTGFPYTVTESFMDLFEGLTYAHADVALAEALHDQVEHRFGHICHKNLHVACICSGNILLGRCFFFLLLLDP